MEKDIVVLTKSSKNSGYCVAGIDIESGEWIRLVSDDVDLHGALTLKDMRYVDGTYCNPLDVVRVRLLDAAPIEHQTENYLVDPNYRWEKLGEWTINDVVDIHSPEELGVLYCNTNTHLDDIDILEVDYSLVLIKVDALKLYLTQNSRGQIKTKASFKYMGRWYSHMSVTDRTYHDISKDVMFDHAYLVVSLPDTPIMGNRYYKFLAKIFPI